MRVDSRAGIALLLVCVLAVAVSACGGGNDTSSTESGTVEPSEVKGTVTVWDNLLGSVPAYDKGAEKLDAEFEKKYPNVTVDHVAIPYASYQQTYKTAFAAEEGPDVMAMAGGVSGVLAYEQGLEILNDRIPPDMDENITNWYTVASGYSPDGDRYGVPIALNAFVFYYNKDMFEEAGLPREFEPETWDEIREAGEKLQAAGIQPFVGGNKEGYLNVNWFSVAWQTMRSTEETVELAEGEIPYTDEVVSEAFEPLLEMQEAGLFPDDYFTDSYFGPGGASALGEEEGAIELGQWALLAYYGEYVPKLGAENVGTFLPPGSNFIGVEPNWTWAIPKFAENKDAAWAYLEFAGSQEGIQIVADANSEFPNRKDVSLPEGLPPQPYELEEASRENETFVVNNILLPIGVQEVLTKELNQVLQGRTSLDSALEGAQEAAGKTSR